MARAQRLSGELRSMGGNILKCILACLHCTKCSEIDIHHSDLQKHILHDISTNNINFSCTHKGFWIYCGLCLEMTRSVFAIALQVSVPFY